MAAGRSTVYNNIVTAEKLNQCNKENLQLGKDFIEYLASIDRSRTTLRAYESDLAIFWVYCADFLSNKFFVDLSKRDIAKFQSHCMNEWGWSPARMRRVKSTLSSLSNYVEGMLDDEFEDFRPIIRKIENPVNVKVREKSVFTNEQVQEILNKLVEKGRYDIACMVGLAAFGGRRKSELPRFKASYFTDDNIIYGSLYKTPEQIKTKGRGSRGKMLTCYTLAKPFKPYLDLWLKDREEKGITSDWLFPAKEDGEYIDEPMNAETLDSWASTISKLTDIPFYFHSLRHFFTSECSRSGLPDDVIQMLIGWQDISMVQVYKDIEADEQFEKYFNADGIVKHEQKSLSDL